MPALHEHGTRAGSARAARIAAASVETSRPVSAPSSGRFGVASRARARSGASASPGARPPSSRAGRPRWRLAYRVHHGGNARAAALRAAPRARAQRRGAEHPGASPRAAAPAPPRREQRVDLREQDRLARRLEAAHAPPAPCAVSAVATAQPAAPPRGAPRSATSPAPPDGSSPATTSTRGGAAAPALTAASPPRRARALRKSAAWRGSWRSTASGCLHAQRERQVRELDHLDHAVGRPRRDEHALARVAHRLVVRRVHRQRTRPDERRELRAGGDDRVVARRVLRGGLLVAAHARVGGGPGGRPRAPRS